MKATISRWTFTLLSAALVSLLVFAGAAAKQDPARRFQEAIDRMETKGDYAGAIQIFEALVKVPDRALAARALYYLGFCHEKLGNDRARQAYEQLIREFSDQIEIVRLAQDKLTLLSQGQAPTAKTDRGFGLQKVGTGPGGGQGEISPDGRFISYIDWSTGDLAVQDLITGQKRRLTDKGSWEKSGAMANNSRWSPDGKFIAYDWWDWDTNPNFVGIRIVSPDGSKTRTLFHVSPDEVTYVSGWSPDAKFILAGIFKKPGLCRIVLIHALDGSARTVQTVADIKGKFINADFSPDGKFLIVERRQEDDPANNDLYIVSIDDGREAPLVKHPANDRLLACAMDGKSVLFASDRRGVVDAWVLELENGKAKGEPRLVKESLGNVEPLGFSSDGSFYYESSRSRNDVYIASFDRETGKLVDVPKKPIDYVGRSSHSPAYSPDGKYLAYILGIDKPGK